MSFFKEQRAYCAVCGQEDLHRLSNHRPILCSKACYDEYEWRYTLCVRGKDYYPRPETDHG